MLDGWNRKLVFNIVLVSWQFFKFPRFKINIKLIKVFVRQRCVLGKEIFIPLIEG